MKFVMPVTYRSKDLEVIANVTGRQLQWWDERGIVCPSQASGHREYTPAEALEICIIADLRRRNIGMVHIRKLVRKLRAVVAQERAADPGFNQRHFFLITDGRDWLKLTPREQVLSVASHRKRAVWILDLSCYKLDTH